MAWSVLQSAFAIAGTTSVTATFPNNATAGTKIIAVVAAADPTSVTSISSVQDAALNSWTQIGSTASNASGAQVSIWARDTPAGDVGIKPAIKATFSAGDAVGITIIEVSGLLAGNTSAMADGTAGTLTGATAATGSPTYSSTAANELLIAAYGDNANNATVVKTSGAWTMVGSNTAGLGNENCLLEYTNSTGGSETNGFTGADTTAWAIVMVAFKLAAGTATAPPDIPQAAPGPTWLRLFKPQWPKPRPPAPPSGPYYGNLPNPSDIPQILPGATWLDLFKPGLARPRPQVPDRGAVQVSGSFTLAPLAFSASGGQTSPDQPQVQPGPVWLDLFKPGLPRPRPSALPGSPQVTVSGSFTLAPLALSAQGAQTSPDQPSAQPGPAWFRLFKPWAQKPPPVPPALQGVSATGSFSLAPLAFTSQGAQTAPDMPAVAPGPVWLRLFRPDLFRPFPPVPATPAVNASGSLSLAPLAFSAAGGQTSPDLPQVQPGPWWIRLFRPDLFKPVPVPPATQAVSAAGSLTLAPLALSGTSAQTSPDQPQASPGPSWLRFFKPWVPRPVPPVAATSILTASGSLSLAPLSLSAQGAQTSPDVTQVQPGPFWLRLFRPQSPKPLPPLPAVQAVNGTASFTLGPVAFSGQGAQTSPDQPEIAPGPVWLRLLRPQVRRPLPPVPAQQPVTSSGSITLAPLAFSGSGTPPLQDQPQALPGPLWLRLFKPWVQHPVPPAPPPWLPPPATATGSFALAPLALSAQAGQTSPDVTQVQPGPVWSRLFRPWQPRPVPPLPAVPAVSATGSLSLAPLAVTAQAARTSPDSPAVQPGPFWLRLFRPWVRRPVPPPPATPAVNAAGSLVLAPLGLSGAGSVTAVSSGDLPQIAPGPAWLKLYKPWVPRPFPASGGAGAPPAALGPPVVFASGSPYFRWAAGTPGLTSDWQSGSPFPGWDTGTPGLDPDWATGNPYFQWEAGVPETSA